jgi:HEAT repeat protein
MMYILIVAGALILITMVVAIGLIVYSRNVSIQSLKSQNRVKEIIEIFQNEHTNIQKRSEAMTALVDIGDLDAIKALLAMLNTHNEAFLEQLAIQLPRLGPQIYPGLRKAFMKAYNRPGVIRVLANIGPAAAEVVLPLLKDPNPIIRNASLQALDQTGWQPGQDAASANYWIIRRQPENCAAIGSAALPALLEALKEPALCLGAIEALGEIGDVSAGWPLLELGKNPKYKIRVIKAIIKWKENALPVLFAGIKEEDLQIRQMALNILDLLPWRPTQNEIGARYWALKHNWEKCVQLGAVAVPPLLELLEDKDKQIQKEVIKSLGGIGDEAALNGLLDLLNRSDDEVRKVVLESLGNFKQAEAVNTLIRNLSENNLSLTAVNALSRIGKPAVGALIQTLSVPDRKMRTLAAETLASLGWIPDTEINRSLYWIARQDWEKCAEVGQGAVDLLVGELNYEASCVEATQALIKIGDPRIIKPILLALPGKTNAIQRPMAEALGSMGSVVVEPLLAELNQGRIDLVPLIQALGESRDERAARPLTEFLKESYPVSVRDTTALALGKIGLPAVDPIFEVLRGEGVNPRAAGIALGIAGINAEDRLIDALKSKTYDAQVLVYALGKIPDEDSARAVLSTLLSSQYGQEIKNTAQEALFEIGEPAIRPIIDGYVRSPDDEAIFSSMLIYFGPVAVEPLVWSLGNSFFPKQIEAIVNVLGEIGDIRAVNPLMNLLKRNNINTKPVNEALDKIWKRQRAEKERYR